MSQHFVFAGDFVSARFSKAVWKRLSTCCNLEHRAATLSQNGHPLDKIELLVLGGTWASYPHAYQEEFCRDLFYAANTFHQRRKRPRLPLAEEQARAAPRRALSL